MIVIAACPAQSNGLVFVATVLASLTSLASSPTSERTAIRVLIIDGQNNHDWRATTPMIRSILDGCGNRLFDVAVATTPPAGAPARAWDYFHPDFSGCELVLLNYYGENWPAGVLERLESFVKGGGGLVAFHAGGSSSLMTRNTTA